MSEHIVIHHDKPSEKEKQILMEMVDILKHSDIRSDQLKCSSIPNLCEKLSLLGLESNKSMGSTSLETSVRSTVKQVPVSSTPCKKKSQGSIESVDSLTVHERLYQNALTFFRKKKEKELEKASESPVAYKKTNTISRSQSLRLYENGIRVRAEAERRRKEETEMIERTSFTPSKTIPISKATAMYERSVSAKKQAQIKLEELKKKEDEKLEMECTSTPSKTISLNKACEIYERGQRFIAMSAVKKEMESLERNDLQKKAILIRPSQAADLYERGIRYKSESIRRAEEEAFENFVTETKTIPLSKATEIYDRGMRMKGKILMDRELKTLSPVKSNDTVIPLSKATSIYYRGMQSKAKSSMMKVEQLLDNASSPKMTIPLSKATGIYDRGLRMKEEHLKKIDAMKYELEARDDH